MISRRFVVSPLLLLVIGCGDGGGSSASAAATDASSSTAGTTQDATTHAATSTATTEPTGGSGGLTDSGSTGTTQGVDPTTGTTTTPGTSTTDPSTTGTSTTDPSTTGNSTAGTSTADGSTTDGSTTDGSTTDGSTTDGSTTDGSSGTTTGSTGSTTSSTTDDSTGEPVEEGLWLVSLEDTSSPTRLYKIDLATGAGTLLCQLDTNNNYNTSTFSREGLLYAANADTKNLEIINPCTCGRTVVGPTNVDALPGITADFDLGLYGLETTLDNFVDIDTNTGNAAVIGPLGVNWGTGGLTWSDVLGGAYAINGTDDRLYTINHLTGAATLLIQTDYNFASVGIEWHPKTKEIYACSNPAELLKVSEQTGAVTVVGPMNLENQAAHCDNLAAPWIPVPCVENK